MTRDQAINNLKIFLGETASLSNPAIDKSVALVVGHGAARGNASIDDLAATQTLAIKAGTCSLMAQAAIDKLMPILFPDEASA